MREFAGDTNDIDEKSTDRMNFRVKPRIRRAIQRAAALGGMDESVFTANTAYRAARETVNSHEHTDLASVDHAGFFEALDNPAPPTDALRSAFAGYKRRVTAR